MGKNGYIGVSAKAKKIKNIYIGVSSKAKKVKKGYVGISKKAQEWFGDIDFSSATLAMYAGSSGSNYTYYYSADHFSTYKQMTTTTYIGRFLIYYNKNWYSVDGRKIYRINDAGVTLIKEYPESSANFKGVDSNGRVLQMFTPSGSVWSGRRQNLFNSSRQNDMPHFSTYGSMDWGRYFPSGSRVYPLVNMQDQEGSRVSYYAVVDDDSEMSYLCKFQYTMGSDNNISNVTSAQVASYGDTNSFIDSLYSDSSNTFVTGSGNSWYHVQSRKYIYPTFYSAYIFRDADGYKMCSSSGALYYMFASYASPSTWTQGSNAPNGYVNYDGEYYFVGKSNGTVSRCKTVNGTYTVVLSGLDNTMPCVRNNTIDGMYATQ